MPLIEELPNTSTTRATHGWAYVPDIGPSKAAIQPGPRKRGAARDHGGGRNDVSVKQQKAIQSRLAELEKENYKDTTIPIPAKPKDARENRGKMTANVRRILTYQRTFAHYLADEEAQIAQTGGQSTTYSVPPQRVGAARTTGQKQANTPTKMGPPPTPSESKFASSSPLVKQESSSNEDGNQLPRSLGGAVDKLPITPYNNEPLLKSSVPKPPSERVMAALLAEPPLSYSAARAKPSTLGQPPRSFCAICGYWGKIRCKKCGERTCGLLECYQLHDKDCQAW